MDYKATCTQSNMCLISKPREIQKVAAYDRWGLKSIFITKLKFENISFWPPKAGECWTEMPSNRVLDSFLHVSMQFKTRCFILMIIQINKVKVMWTIVSNLFSASNLSILFHSLFTKDSCSCSKAFSNSIFSRRNYKFIINFKHVFRTLVKLHHFISCQQILFCHRVIF